MTFTQVRPHARRPHNRTANAELRRHTIVDGIEPGDAPHVYATTAMGEVQVYPLANEDIALLARQTIAMVARRIDDSALAELAVKAVDLAIGRLRKSREER
jgi:hypothetical protein